MSDLISRSKLIEEIREGDFLWIDGDADKKMAINLIKRQPSVEDVPGMVRCKNCTHWGTGFAGETEHVKCCELAIYMVGENGYCVYGDKK